MRARCPRYSQLVHDRLYTREWKAGRGLSCHSSKGRSARSSARFRPHPGRLLRTYEVPGQCGQPTMKFKKWTMFRSKRTRSVLRWCRFPFLLIGLIVLAYCGCVVLDAKIFQAYATWRFQQAFKRTTPTNGSSEGSHPLIPAAAPSGTGNVGTESRGGVGLKGSILGRI